MAKAHSRGARSDADTSAELPGELNFDDDRSGPLRTGDGRPMRITTREEARLRYDEGGGVPDSTVDNEATADDLAPETLFDETGGGRPLVSQDINDLTLRVVDEDSIGTGGGLDEAEEAVARGGGPDGDDALDVDDDSSDDDPDAEDAGLDEFDVAPTDGRHRR